MKSKMPDNERVIEKQLEERFSLSHVHMQSVSRSRVNGRLLQIDFSGVGHRMTIAGLRRLCEDISAMVGGILYGTVNIDYSGDVISVEMMVEIYK
jgi:hypothetical protein